MGIQVVRLGSERQSEEGIRIGTVRRPPRGVKKADYAAQNWYDTWLPNLSPSPETMKMGQAAQSPGEWKRFKAAYKKEMARPENARILELLAALSHTANFSVGCYCEDETHCHRSVLGELLRAAGAVIKE
ncbi:MAG: DUF488 family protein [Desulfobacterales bacterium]|nr:DUF488 family protein [Desulfobacterales bacterium]